jgi:hypothetical protein
LVPSPDPPTTSRHDGLRPGSTPGVPLAVRKKEGTMNKLQEIRFVEEPPRPRSGMSGQWMQQLDPLRSFPGRWALIYTCEHPNAANKLQSNLHGRKVLIPEPNHTWEFAARGCEVYAVYRGRKKGGEKAVRNSTNRR